MCGKVTIDAAVEQIFKARKQRALNIMMMVGDVGSGPDTCNSSPRGDTYI
jgi:hypothetical protein